ncbi:MAG: hypothetical protein M3345_04615 [Actinomycetota bacterium]|nr:hypothetical protein [Actinomycetota bacterium]
MSTGKLAVAGLALSLALGGGLVALADDPTTSEVREIDLDDRDGAVLRRDDAADDAMAVDDDDKDPTGDGDRTRGNDGTQGGDNTGDGDATAGNDGTAGGDNTGDGGGDATGGDDSGGGTN